MAKVKKGLALLVVLVTAFSAFAGCNRQSSGDASSDKNSTNAGAKEEKVKLSLCLAQTGWGGEAIDPDLMEQVKKVIEEKTNTEIEMIAPPLSSYNEKLNVLLSSGQFPDIFSVSKAMDTLQVYAARGYTMPLNDLLKEMPQLSNAIDPKYFEYLRVDGKIHAIPRYVPMSKVIWTRKDVFSKYGVTLSETPTTDEFYTQMKKLTNQGVIPFSFPKWLDNLSFFYHAFGAYGGIGIDTSGKFYDGFNTPEMKEALNYIKMLYKDGIWDKEFLTNENSNIREKLSTGRAASTIDYYNRFIYYSAESNKQKVETEFVPIYELKGPKGGMGNLNEAIQVVAAISSKSKVPKKALEVIHWFFYTEEGEKTGMLGIEGKHYTVENGQIKPTEKAANSGYKGSIDNFFLSNVPLPTFNFKWDETTEKYLSQQKKVNEEVNKHLGPKYLVPGGKSELYDRNQPSYKKKIEEIASKIIIGGTTLEQGFVEYEAFWKSIEGNKMLEELNK